MKRHRRNPDWGTVVTLGALGTLGYIYLKRPRAVGLWNELPGPRLCIPNCQPYAPCYQTAYLARDGVCAQGYL